MKKQELTYEVIKDVKYGDENAIEVIMEHYEPYIITLSKRPYCGQEGVVEDLVYDAEAVPSRSDTKH